jgi:hypothetical protein
MESNRTAVAWLVDALTDNGISHLDLAYEIIEQAEKVFEQQIIDAFKSGDCNGTFETISGEEYFEERYGK